MPRSQATLRHSEDYTALVHQNVQLRIIQCEGRHIVGSIRSVLAEKADAAREVFWQTVEVGKKYTGTVKSLTNYGAFVDIGGVDGLVPVSYTHLPLSEMLISGRGLASVQVDAQDGAIVLRV